MTTASKGAMTKIYTYARTMKSNSDYAHNMARLSAQIFGEVSMYVTGGRKASNL